jgi:hypothetical protein
MDLRSNALGAFAEAVSAAETASDGFGLADIAAVASAWETVDGSVRSFGWIVDLRRGGRRYLEYKVDADAGGAAHDVAVTPLAADGPLPMACISARWFDPSGVNSALRHHNAQLAALLNNLP